MQSTASILIPALTPGAVIGRILARRSEKGFDEYTAARIAAFTATIDRYFRSNNTSFSIYFNSGSAYFTLPEDDPFSDVGPGRIISTWPATVSLADLGELDEDAERTTSPLEHCTHVEHRFTDYTPILCSKGSVTVNDAAIWQMPRSTGEALRHILKLRANAPGEGVYVAIDRLTERIDRFFASNTGTLTLEFTSEGVTMPLAEGDNYSEEGEDDIEPIPTRLHPGSYPEVMHSFTDLSTLTFTDERVDNGNELLWFKPV